MGSGTAFRTSVALLLLLAPLARCRADAVTARPSAAGVCSTWGRSHWRTADGAFFRLPSSCNHRAVGDGDGYESFDVQVRRRAARGAGADAIQAVLVRLDGDVLELRPPGAVRVNGKSVSLPVVEPGLVIEKTSAGLVVRSRFGIQLVWNLEDALSIDMDGKYEGSLCGLCGNFDGIDNEFAKDGAPLSVAEYAARHKVGGPAETCDEAADQPAPRPDCGHEELCARLFSAAAFSGCRNLVDADALARACASDVCASGQHRPAPTALCQSASELSRQCVRAGGAPGAWRNATFCPHECPAPKVYVDCLAAPPGSTGTECESSCATLDTACISHGCVSGCACPDGLVSDGLGGCIEAGECPCVHNGQSYRPGHVLQVDCNACTCTGRKFTCTSNVCDAVCAIYGNGHLITFDDKRIDFPGQCEHTLVQDYCGDNETEGSFRIVSRNVACGSSATTSCSKMVKIFVQDDEEYHLREEKFHVIRSRRRLFPAQVRQMGIYTVVTIQPGVVLMWDKKTSVFIKLAPRYQGKVCGLCGNYDGNIGNDLAKRSGENVADALAFASSWTASESDCPAAARLGSPSDPCGNNRYRAEWAERRCGVIIGPTFQACHSRVDPGPYYDACVRDACACDSSGDSECVCTAVAAYSKACSEAGACVRWRRPEFCRKSSAIMVEACRCGATACLEELPGP